MLMPGPDSPMASRICAPATRQWTSRALLAAVLADGTNLGLARMADASHGISHHHLVNVA
jgi:hypothetical protein